MSKHPTDKQAPESGEREPSDPRVLEGGAAVQVSDGRAESDLSAGALNQRLSRTGTRPRRVIAVSGAKGGVGKSLVAANLSIYLSSLGRSVLATDADVAGAHLHTFLGIAPEQAISRSRRARGGPDGGVESSVASEVLESSIPGLSFLLGGVDPAPPGGMPGRGRPSLIAALDSVDVDYMVLDLGAGLEEDLLQAYLDADLALYVTAPEPAAVEATYRFLRSLFLHRLRDGLEPEQSAALDEELRPVAGMVAPRELVEDLERRRHGLAERAREVLDSLNVHLLLNQGRVRADLELGPSMQSAVKRRFGMNLNYLGCVDYDDTVWTCVRQREPLLIRNPATKASKSIEKLARRVLALDAGKLSIAAGRNVPVDSLHDLLEVDRGATDEEVRRAYRRCRQVYADGALCCYGLFCSEELDDLRSRLEEAYDVLLDPARRRPYELSIFPEEEQGDARPDELDSSDNENPPAPHITPDTDFDGALLRAVRHSLGIELKQVSRHTKIGIPYLEAIEQDDFSALPAVVYVRGFVTELAKYLRLDPNQVSQTYVRRLRRKLAEQGTA